MKTKSLQRLLIAGMTLGVVMMCGPFIGALATVARLQGVIDAEGMSTKQGAEYSMEPTAWGLFICPLGLLLLILCVLFWRKSVKPESE